MTDAPRILIATPIYGRPESGTVHFGYHTAVRKLERGGAKVIGDVATSEDLVHGRNRMTWAALNRDDWDWVLWWDSDVIVADTSIVFRMIDAAKRQDALVIAAPYPRKSIPATFPYRPMPGEMKAGKLSVKDECITVQAVGFGFTMTHRQCLESMVKRYHEEQWYRDTVAGDWVEMVNIFGLVMTETIEAENSKTKERVKLRELLNEDYSFSYRWGEMGGKILVYVGDGTPLGHCGQHLFEAGSHEIGSVK